MAQPISAARAAALLAVLVPPVVRVELHPQWSDGTGEVVRHTRAVPLDSAGREIEMAPQERREVAAILRRIGDMDMDRPQVLAVPGGEVSPWTPVVLPLAEALGDADAPIPFVLTDAAEVTAGGAL